MLAQYSIQIALSIHHNTPRPPASICVPLIRNLLSMNRSRRNENTTNNNNNKNRSTKLAKIATGKLRWVRHVSSIIKSAVHWTHSFSHCCTFSITRLILHNSPPFDCIALIFQWAESTQNKSHRYLFFDFNFNSTLRISPFSSHRVLCGPVWMCSGSVHWLNKKRDKKTATTTTIERDVERQARGNKEIERWRKGELRLTGTMAIALPHPFSFITNYFQANISPRLPMRCPVFGSHSKTIGHFANNDIFKEPWFLNVHQKYLQ